jgi:hypothetical protein
LFLARMGDEVVGLGGIQRRNGDKGDKDMIRDGVGLVGW